MNQDLDIVQTHRKNSSLRIHNYINTSLGGLFIVALIGLFVYVYRKNKRNPKPEITSISLPIVNPPTIPLHQIHHPLRSSEYETPREPSPSSLKSISNNFVRKSIRIPVHNAPSKI